MRRDWETIRTIMLRVEAASFGSEVRLVDFSELDQELVAHNAILLIDKGLADGATSAEISAEVPDFFITGLTWDGHDFLDSIRKDSFFREVLAKASETSGNLSFEVVKAVAYTLAMRALQ